MWQSTPNSGGYFSTQETYYPNGALGSRTSVLGAASYGYPTISYGLDGEGRPTTATDTTNSLNLITGTSYNVAGLPTSVTFGNSSSGAADVDTFQYDANTNRPISIANTVNASSGPWLMNTGLTWWPNGSLQQMTITDSGDTTKNQTCNYSADDLGRLAIANCGCSTWAQSYSYDAFGNINKSLISGGTGTTYSAAYSSGSNHVSGGPSYDANGNQLSSTGLSSISWNAYGQAVSVSAIANEPYTGTYDAAGRLVEITLPSGGTQQFVYSPSGAKIAVVQQAQPGGPLVKGTVSLPGRGTAIYNSSGLSYLRHTDWLGSSRLATTWNHGVYSKESYAPFGETYNEQANTSGGPDRSFTGQDQDVVTGSQGTGIYEFMFRKYDPAAGRWLSPDPMGWGSASLENPQSLNRYAYVMNSPLNNIDPSGKECVWDDGSFDEEGDPETGTPGQCQHEGGTWIELGYNGGWSASSNTQLAGWVSQVENWAENGLSGYITTYNPGTGITSFTSYNSSGLVDWTGTSGTITKYGYEPGSVMAFPLYSYFDPGSINAIYSMAQQDQLAQQNPDEYRIQQLSFDIDSTLRHPMGADLRQSLCNYATFMGLSSLGITAGPVLTSANGYVSTGEVVLNKAWFAVGAASTAYGAGCN